VDFELDEAQQAVVDLAATVLRPDADHARIEQALASPAGFDETAWKSLAQAGLLALAVPEGLGGDGGGAVEVGLVLAAAGRQTLPLPAFATLALGVLPVARYGTPAQQQELLADVANGRVLSAALREAPDSSIVLDGVLDGARVGVPYAAQAHRLLVPTGQGTAVVDPRSRGVSLIRTPSSTGAPEYTVRFDRAPVEDVLAASARDVDACAVAGAAAVADGTVAGALALTAAHIRERQQFGKPLATFQAVAQQVADVYVVARTMHLAAVSAAWRLDAGLHDGLDDGVNDGLHDGLHDGVNGGLDATEDLAVAAHWLAAEVPPALQTCHHLHGGLGVDVTYPLHRYFGQAKDLARLVGGAAARLDALGALCTSS
jgi:alkylation response protein AidB-like acyl-CoA dehydrogenase